MMGRETIWSLAVRIIAALALLFCGFQIAAQQAPAVAPPSKTNTYAEDEKGRKIRVQRGELPAGNFRVAGVDLTKQQDVLEQATRVLGRGVSAASGDAAGWDESVCYRAAESTDGTRLFFGKGEMNFYYTLASEAGPLKPHQSCRRSKLVTKTIETGSGIRLGMTPRDLISALGLPTRRSEHARLHTEVLEWSFELKKKASEEDLARARKSNPGQTEAEVRQNYGFYWQSETIKSRFKDGQLTEITADWLASY